MKRLVDAIRRSLAITRWIRTADKSGLDELGVAAELIGGRKRGRPRKIPFTDEQVVQLVYKRQLQQGLPFTNVQGADNNPCFHTVADALGVNVGAVRGAYSRVPSLRRDEIKAWLKRELEANGKLDPRYTKSE
jgi:hypothetical protein